MNRELTKTMGSYEIEECLSWRKWVTPKPLEQKRIHRWYVFPHSFTSELVNGLISDWGLGSDDVILDPFAGAGTTLVTAKENGLSATGYDLSPFAVLVASAKVADYNVEELEAAWSKLQRNIEKLGRSRERREYPTLIKKALPGKLLGAFDNVDKSINELSAPIIVRNFFRLALLSRIPMFSRAVASGGWLRWVRNTRRSTSLSRALGERVSMMMDDVRKSSVRKVGVWKMKTCDARSIPDEGDKFSAVITSPPYPNRHDYTRVFGVELMFGFLDWASTRELRYQSFHSHPEARPKRELANGYRKPLGLIEILSYLDQANKDSRIYRMIDGYFTDTYLSLRAIRRRCRTNARIAWVVGNAQYFGKSIPVDELTAEIGEQVGLRCEKLMVARYRGNSAQQMAQFGRNPSRESVVIFRA